MFLPPLRNFLLQVDGECQLAPGFISPPNSDYVGYHQYIDDFLPDESPYLYGLHPNAEIGYLTTVSERLFKVILTFIYHIAFPVSPYTTNYVNENEKTSLHKKCIFMYLLNIILPAGGIRNATSRYRSTSWWRSVQGRNCTTLFAQQFLIMF